LNGRDGHGVVLLLEDEAVIAVALQDDLEDAGYSVAGPFTTCAAALDWLADETPDFAILDTVLKDGPCKEVALKLKHTDVPFLVYSGNTEDLNIIGDVAAAEWVEKPAPPQVLLQALESLRSTSSSKA
jgi:DNA-binding response OmpR family regulator